MDVLGPQITDTAADGVPAEAGVSVDGLVAGLPLFVTGSLPGTLEPAFSVSSGPDAGGCEGGGGNWNTGMFFIRADLSRELLPPGPFTR